MKRRTIKFGTISFALACLFCQLYSAHAQNVVTVPGESKRYFVYDPGKPVETITFVGVGRYGTPCNEEPHYAYRWESNNTGVLSLSDKFVLKVNDSLLMPWNPTFPLRHNITFKVKDCTGAEASSSVEIVIVLPLKAEITEPENGTSFDCLVSLSGKVSGGLPPYTVKWKTEKDGTIKEYVSNKPGEEYGIKTTPPMLFPLTSGRNDLMLYAKDSLGLNASDQRSNIMFGWCCAINTSCKTYWPAHEGKMVCTGNEESHSCDIFEVCHPQLWEKARKALYCCENGCPSGCNEYCNNALKLSEGIPDSYDKLKKCAGLYIVYGLGPAREYMEGYFWPEVACAGMDQALIECCVEDLGKCGCSNYKYNKNTAALPCKPNYPAASPGAWMSDIAMNVNTCRFSDLPAHVSILNENEGGIHTGTCGDYSIALTTLLRLVGYNRDEVYTVVGPGHEFNLVKFPGTDKWNLVDTTGNRANPYTQFNLPISKYGTNYCLYANPLYCPGCIGVNCIGSGCVETYPRCCTNDYSTNDCPQTTNVYGCS